MNERVLPGMGCLLLTMGTVTTVAAEKAKPAGHRRTVTRNQSS